MKYSPELIKEVKECYPDKPNLHKLAESGSLHLQDEIDPSWGVVHVDLVLKATSFKEIKKYCAHIKRKEKICDMVAREISNNDLK